MRLRASLDFHDGQPPIAVGTLAWSDDERRAYVEWSDEVRERDLKISPFLVRDWTRLHTTDNPRAFHGLPAVFGDSVPDGWGRLLMDRELLGRENAVPRPMAHLAMVGAYGMGAMCYEPADETAKRVSDLSLDYFARTSDDIETIDHDVLAGLRAVSGGSQGARPKFVALLDEQTSRYRDHRSEWQPGLRHVLIKRAARDDLPSAVPVEAAYARAAKAAGIAMEETDIVRAANGERFFQTNRFDRSGSRRLHMQSAAALTDQDYRGGALTYENLFQISRSLHGDDRDAEQLLRRLVFNVASVNQDDHAKNHAWLMTRDGTWALSPAFDITHVRSPSGYHAMGLSRDDMDMHPGAILNLAGRHGIAELRARAIVRDVADVVETLPQILKDEGVPPKTAKTIGTATLSAMKQLPLRKPGRLRTR